MRKLHQNEIPDPLVSEGEYIEYTTNNGMVFHVLAVKNDTQWSCRECIFFRLKDKSSASGNDYYICNCGPHGENSLCYRGGANNEISRAYCKFVDVDTLLENL